MGTQYKLTYFNYRGLAEASRFIFAYTGTAYEDKRISQEDWKGGEKEKYEWGVLPVLEFDGKKLTQSNAILRYLGRIFNLAGENDFESAKCDEYIEAMSDLVKATSAAFYATDETKKAELIATLKKETIPKYMTQWSKAIIRNGGFLVGNKFSYADFRIASAMEGFNDFMEGTLLDNFPAMKSHLDSVFSAKGIKEWVEKRPKTPF